MKYGKAAYLNSVKRLRNPFHCVAPGDDTRAICHITIVLDKNTLTDTEPRGKDLCMKCRRVITR